MEVDDLFPGRDAADVSLPIEGGDIRLTDMGRQFADADIDDRSDCSSAIARLRADRCPYSPRKRDRANHVALKSRFLDEPEDHGSRVRRPCARGGVGGHARPSPATMNWDVQPGESERCCAEFWGHP
jgi:hypothetical protein